MASILGQSESSRGDLEVRSDIAGITRFEYNVEVGDKTTESMDLTRLNRFR